MQQGIFWKIKLFWLTEYMKNGNIKHKSKKKAKKRNTTPDTGFRKLLDDAKQQKDPLELTSERLPEILQKYVEE